MPLTTVSLLAPLLLIGSLGALCARSGRFHRALPPLNDFVFHMTPPCYLFTVTSKAPRPSGGMPWSVMLPGPVLAGATAPCAPFVTGLAIPSASAALNPAIAYDHAPDAAAPVIVATMALFP